MARALRICTHIHCLHTYWYLYICFLVCLVLRRAAIFFGHLGSNRVSACTFCIHCGDRLGAIGGARLSLHDPGPYQCHGETWWNRKQTTTHPNRKQNKEGLICPQSQPRWRRRPSPNRSKGHGGGGEHSPDRSPVFGEGGDRSPDRKFCSHGIIIAARIATTAAQP